MRNQFPGTCYRCGERVEAGAGHFELASTKPRAWRTQHAECAIAYRNAGRNFKGERPASIAAAQAVYDRLRSERAAQ